MAAGSTIINDKMMHF